MKPSTSHTNLADGGTIAQPAEFNVSYGHAKAWPHRRQSAKQLATAAGNALRIRCCALAADDGSARPLLLQALLAPLFTSYNSELAADDGAWNDAHGALHADDAAIDASVGASSCGPAVKRLLSIKKHILHHLAALQEVDNCYGINRALMHALLFAAWDRSRASRAATCPTDDFSPDAPWRLSTGTPRSLLCVRRLNTHECGRLMMGCVSPDR